MPGKEQYVVCRRQAQGLVVHGARTVGGSPAFRIAVSASKLRECGPRWRRVPVRLRVVTMYINGVYRLRWRSSTHASPQLCALGVEWPRWQMMYCEVALRTIVVTVFVKRLIEINWHPDSRRFSRLLYRGCCAIPWPLTTTVAVDEKNKQNTIKMQQFVICTASVV